MSQIKDNILEIINSDNQTNTKLQGICDLLNKSLPKYDWVGFYFRNGEKEELKLGPYTGEETEHTLIPFGKGICGQVAVSNENFVVEDVSSQDNYISCGWKVKSEIVIPVFKNGENIGQIDIDSHTVNAFGETDEKLLEFVCEKVAELEGIEEQYKL
jgi:GAF domain-containing protein